MIYEHRIYHVIPGKMPAILNRLQNTTVGLFERYGIRPIGFWTTFIGESSLDLTYIIAWQSLAEREQKWAKFASDPELQAEIAETERDGAIVGSVSVQFLKPTAFSPLP